jgi:hypothetical protein
MAEHVCAQCGEPIAVPEGAAVAARSAEILDGRAIEHVVSVKGVDVHRCIRNIRESR